MERREFIKAVGGTGCAGLFGGCALFRDELRYRSGGELHRDFHASILDGYNYIRDNYGEGAIREVVAAFARGVYRTMHEKLAAGDPSELLEYWRYYMTREGGDFGVAETADGAVFSVRGCPALRHLANRKVDGGEGLCALTRLFNEELTRDTPYEIVQSCADGVCRQALKRKGGAA